MVIFWPTGTDPLGQPAAIDPGAQLDPRAQSKGADPHAQCANA